MSKDDEAFTYFVLALFSLFVLGCSTAVLTWAYLDKKCPYAHAKGADGEPERERGAGK